MWDIEDVVALAIRHKECGYYYSREAIVEANIVFCPYNYILDPAIRRAVGISLKNAVVIFDEAHNVEDTCRSSASIDLHSDVLDISIMAFEKVFTHERRPWFCYTMHRILEGLSRWMQNINENASTILEPTALDEESNVWSGTDAVEMFAKYTGTTQISIASVKEDLESVLEHERTLSVLGYEEGDEDDEESSSKILLGALPLSTIQKVITVADYMFREKFKHIDDLKLIFHRSRKSDRRSRRFPAEDTKSNPWEIKMCIWCLNAAVAFSDVTKKARSVILTSETLSPMDSFTGELGTNFPIRLEASHVVNMRKQVFAGAIMRGPGCADLSSTYMNQQEREGTNTPWETCCCSSRK